MSGSDKARNKAQRLKGTRKSNRVTPSAADQVGSSDSSQLWPEVLFEQATGILMNRFDLYAAHASQNAPSTTTCHWKPCAALKLKT